ncbi:MAG: hypothetical protein K1060chlam2_01398 [Chlamydiae bacterium]|nr:hypothetical protein [Chlamydiota bacterium]
MTQAHHYESGLMAAEMATIRWQSSIQGAMQYCAATVALLVMVLQKLNEDGGNDYSKYMKQIPIIGKNFILNGKPIPVTKDNFGTLMSAFQANLHELQEKYTIAKNPWNTCVQSDTQTLQQEGTGSQQASQMAGTVTQLGMKTGSLLGQAL